MEVVKIACRSCGGRLVQQGAFCECEDCGTQWHMRLEHDGTDLSYRSIQRKEVQPGRFAARSSQIQVQPTMVKEINVQTQRRGALQFSYDEHIQLIKSYLENGDWDSAREQISQLLREDPSCGEANWYKLACDRQAHSNFELIQSLTNISHTELSRIEVVIQNSPPDFSRDIINNIFSMGYVGDESTFKLIELVYPYMHGLYTVEQWRKKVAFAFDMVIVEGYCKTFEYLLTHALAPDEVDRYIDYLEQFAAKCTLETAQRYYTMILEVDAGNLKIHRKLVGADLESGTPVKTCTEDLEHLLAYSPDRDQEILELVHYLIGQPRTTKTKCNFMWSLLSYYSDGQNGLPEEKKAYAQLLLRSKMWKESHEFYNLLLHINRNNPEAYFGLFLADQQAVDDQELDRKSVV